MNLQFSHLLPAHFSPGSRVWIYQSDRPFTISELLEMEGLIHEFVGSWKTHGADVEGFGTVFFGRFIVLMADESRETVGGCSTDSSVRFIKELEKRFEVNMFNRNLLAFYVRDKIELIPLNQLDYALQHGFIQPETLYFNNTVPNLEALRDNWIIPVAESWLSRKLGKARQA